MCDFQKHKASYLLLQISPAALDCEHTCGLLMISKHCHRSVASFEQWKYQSDPSVWLKAGTKAVNWLTSPQFSILQAILASFLCQHVSHTVPQLPLRCTSTLPEHRSRPPVSRRALYSSLKWEKTCEQTHAMRKKTHKINSTHSTLVSPLTQTRLISLVGFFFTITAFILQLGSSNTFWRGNYIFFYLKWLHN